VSVLAAARCESAAKATAPRQGFGEAVNGPPAPPSPTPVDETPMPIAASEDVTGLTNKPPL